MPEKIGKYQVLERIGRGGMGMIFKAHDPILDRPVALKVISSEVEVTDELRARFFREAQACARLSHPNIVTVYDMGEDDGRLYIVMELLEGEELRRLIAQRAPLGLEDKLAIMGQVCDGLHYAHQKGIVHRDIKPGNIMLLPNRQVKILDFGLAQIAASSGGLTRTGLIMGTLRYISPEQVQGRADHRSDIFSVGAVFYEFLSFRPPFTGEDSMQLLEQLRTEDPPRLSELDPTIPPELGAIVEQAMRKDPQQRFATLDQMRAQLGEVQQGLAEEAERVRARVRGQRDRLRELQAALAERVGPPKEEAAVPAIDERARLAATQALERDLAGRIETVLAKIARADALAPALQRGIELLRAGQFADAGAEFEAVVADMPEHARALDGLVEARAQAEAHRRRQLAAQLVQDARTARDEGGYTLCLELLKQASEIPPPAEVAPEIAALRRSAEGLLAAREVSPPARQQAEQARDQMAQARRTAQAQAAAQYAPALWKDAEATSTAAQAALARAAYAKAAQTFDAAGAAYHRGEEVAREEQRREREELAQARARARAAGAPRYAREAWDAAEAKSVEAEATFATKAVGRALEGRRDAMALYRRAEEQARAAAPAIASAASASEPPGARKVVSAVRGDDATGAAAYTGATRLPPAAPRVGDPGSTGFRRRAHELPGSEPRRPRARGARVIVVALGGLAATLMTLFYWLPRPLPPVSPPAVAITPAPKPVPVPDRPPETPAGRDAADDFRKRVIAAREEAAHADAERLAPTQFAAAADKAREAEAALGRRDMASARQRYQEALEGYGLATAEATRIADLSHREAQARVVESRAAEARRDAEKAASRRAPASAGEREPMALPKRDLKEAGQQRVAAVDRQQSDAEQARARMASARRDAEQSAAGYYAPKLFASAQTKERDGATALARADYGSAIGLLGEAQSDYRAAAQEAKQEAEKERQLAPLKASVEQARARCGARREQAVTAEANRFAKDLFEAAQAKHVEADGLATRQNFAAAALAYQDAAERYMHAALRAQAARETK